MTIVIVRDYLDGEFHVNEIETEYKETFDTMVNYVHGAKTAKAAYLVGNDGKMLDSYIK